MSLNLDFSKLLVFAAFAVGGAAAGDLLFNSKLDLHTIVSRLNFIKSLRLLISLGSMAIVFRFAAGGSGGIGGTGAGITFGIDTLAFFHGRQRDELGGSDGTDMVSS